MKFFSAKIYIIGVNPYVMLPPDLLKHIFQKIGKDKGAISVKLKIGVKNFIGESLASYQIFGNFLSFSNSNFVTSQYGIKRSHKH